MLEFIAMLIYMNILKIITKNQKLKLNQGNIRDTSSIYCLNISFQTQRAVIDPSNYIVAS